LLVINRHLRSVVLCVDCSGKGYDEGSFKIGHTLSVVQVKKGVFSFHSTRINQLNQVCVALVALVVLVVQTAALAEACPNGGGQRGGGEGGHQRG
jgi:hypothetical protein